MPAKSKKVLKQKMIYRYQLQAHPEVLYLFGDNDKRLGYGGQAREMRDEPNAVGVRTKWAPGMAEHEFFSDVNLPMNKMMIASDLVRVIDHLKAGGTVVIPEDGLGTGLSQLPTRAPLTNAYLVETLKMLEEI